jgi:hypothetical protein
VTFDERVAAIGAKGFTERQARFLVTVLLHAGVCMVRQYCAFSHISRGQTTQEFFGRLVEKKYATVYSDAHRRARIFHLQHRSLYEAIGEPDNRHRKPTPIAGAIERLMVLDAVLSSTDLTWLATEREKVAHFTKLLGTAFRRDDLPRLVFGHPPRSTVRFFPDKMPIGIHADGRTHVFAYLVTRPAPSTSERFCNARRNCCAPYQAGASDCWCRRISRALVTRTAPRSIRNWQRRYAPLSPANCSGTSSARRHRRRTAIRRPLVS